MYKIINHFILFTTINCFVNPSAPKVKTFKYAGSVKPFENFDPAFILKDKSENRIKFTREAELQHGRLAMLATTMIPIIPAAANEVRNPRQSSSPQRISDNAAIHALKVPSFIPIL